MRKIERIRETVARKLIWWAKKIDPGNKRLMNAEEHWRVDFEWVQPVSLSDTAVRARR